MAAPGAMATATNKTVTIEATVQGGTSADLNVDEAAAGYIQVKYGVTPTYATKAYFQFDLTGMNPDPNLGATFTVTFRSTFLHRVKLWGLKQAYPGFNTNITWNTAQANDIDSNELLTSGSFTASRIGPEVLLPLSGTNPYTFVIPKLGTFLLGNKITFVLTGVDDTYSSSAGLRIRRLQSVLAFNMPVQPTHYDVYLVGGQSNADGAPATTNLVDDLADWQLPQPDVRIYYADPTNLDPINPTYNSGWDFLAPGFTVSAHYDGVLPSEKFGPELSFGRTIADDYANRHVAIIKVAKGATSLTTDWNPAGGYMYQTLTNMVRVALQSLTSEGSSYTLRGMIWHQGESDGGDSTIVYQGKLTNLINSVRHDIGVADLPFVAGELATNRSMTVRQAQYNVSQVMPYVGFASSSNLVTLAPDDPHFNARGQIIMGQRMAAAMELISTEITWDAAGANHAWSTATNWDIRLPGTADSAMFMDSAASDTAGDITCIMDSNRTIAGLNFGDGILGDSLHHGIQINSGQTLTVSGAFTATTFGSDTLTIKGATAGVGVLSVGSGTTGADSFMVGAAATVSTDTSVDMSGLGTFTANVNSFEVGGHCNTSGYTGGGILSLANTSTITANTFSVGNFAHGGNNLDSGTLSLGQVNTINSDTIMIGGGKNIGTVQFRSGLSGTPTVQIRNVAGTGRTTLKVGNSLGSGLQPSGGTLDLTAGTSGRVDAQISTLDVGQISSVNQNAIGVMNWAAGTVDASTVTIGSNISGVTGGNANGTMNLSGTAAMIAETLTLADKADVDGAVTGALAMSDSATLKAATIQKGSNAGGTATATFTWTAGTIQNKSGGDLTIQALSGALNLDVTGPGPHEFNADVDRTITVASTAGLRGNGSLTKTGSGTLTLSGTNTCTGATTVSNGTLLVTGSVASPVTILSGATIGGTGTIKSNLVVNAGAFIAARLPGPKLTVTGNLTIAGAVNITDAGGFGVGTYTLMTYTGTLTNNGLTIGTTPDPAYACNIDTNTAHQINLNVALTPFATWQVAQFGSFTNTDAAAGADPDHDRLNNEQEYLTGTIPTNGNSVLRLDALHGNTGMGFDMSWPGVTGRTYRVAYSHSLTGEWLTNLPSSLLTPLPGQTNLTYTDTTTETETNRFYRLNLVAP